MKKLWWLLLIAPTNVGGSDGNGVGSSSSSKSSSTVPTAQDVSMLLRVAKEHATQHDAIKAAHYYREVIGGLGPAVEVDGYEFDGPALPADPRHKLLATALFEASDVLERAGMLGRNASAVSESYDYLFRAAALGHPDAQHRLAAAYATGIYGGALVQVDAGRSLVLEYMAALGGHPEACMGMGYRYLHGIGVPESCEKAQIYYEYAANEAAEQIRALGTGGAHPRYSERLKLSDVEVAVSKGRKDVDPEVIDYYKHLAAGGDANAANNLGSMYMQGSRFVDQDVDRAFHYFRLAADAGHVSASAQLGYLLAQRLSNKLLKQREAEKRAGAGAGAGAGPGAGTATAGAGAATASAADVASEKATTGGRPKGGAAKPLEQRATGGNGKVPEPVSGSKKSGDTATQPPSARALPPRNDTELAMEVEMIVKLFRYAANRGDPLGHVGLGYLHYTALADVIDVPNQAQAVLGQVRRRDRCEHA
jgi:hypothetical protein